MTRGSPVGYQTSVTNRTGVVNRTAVIYRGAGGRSEVAILGFRATPALGYK
jgi:hypothetical protein